MSQRNKAGGRAGAGGFDYQHRGVAWLATRILAGAAVPPVIPTWTSPLRRVDCETGEPVDDSRLLHDDGPPLVAQYKHSLDMSSAVDSEMAKTVEQFVDHHRLEGHGLDNMMLVTGPQASGPVRHTLRLVLDRIREADPATVVDDIPFNDEERRAYDVFVGHVDRTWQARTGSDPTAAEVRTLMRRCHVLPLDVDPGGSDELAVRQLLRTSVVADPDLGDAAWEALIERCARFAADRSGADREQLQQYLLSRGIKLRTVLEYDRDVDRLRGANDGALAALEASLVTIPAPDGEIDVRRQSVDDVIIRAASGPMLVVGDPGIGKTVALHHVARNELAAGRPVLLLSVGTTVATSFGQLRNELGLEHDLLQVLAQWSPGEPKLMIVDALDAARNDPQADLWRTLIDIVSAQLPDWRVVASVRTWDLRHSPRLRAQFPGPATRLDELDDTELEHVASGWPALGELVRSAPDDFQRLLRNLFNLRLAAELLIAGTAIAELWDIHDRLELLDRYWQHRVSDGHSGMGRHALLASVCDIAVRERTLTVPVNQLLGGDATAGDVLDTLLSRSVLADATAVPGTPGLGAVRFAHHVLFDYAVALTVFAVTEDALTRRLHDDPDLVLFARPSIDMHLQRLWTAARDLFWKVARAVGADEGLLRLATVAVAEVVARLAVVLPDLAELLDPIVEGKGSDAQHRMLRYVALAAVIDREEHDDSPPGVWPEVVDRLSDNVAAAELPLRILLDDLSRNRPVGADLDRCGRAARRQLEFIWNQPPSGVGPLAIEAVLATAPSDLAATEALLRRALQPDRMAIYGANDLHWLCDATPTLAQLMPSFVEDLYVSVMQYEEESNESTYLLASRILPLTSTRRQDVEQAKWNLVQHYGSFLEANPERALAALARLVESQAQLGTETSATLAGRSVRVIADASESWDDRTLADEHDVLSLLNSFEDHLAGLDDNGTVDRWLDLRASMPLPAAIWRRVLNAATQNERVAIQCVPFSETVSAWAHTDLLDSLAQLLNVRFPGYSADERARVEAAISTMEPGDDDGSPEWYHARYRYHRLLHALDAAAIVDEATAAAQAGSSPPMPPRGTRGMASFRPFEDSTDRYGIHLDTDADRTGWALIEPIRSFVDEHLNEAPDDDAVQVSLKAVERLLRAPEYEQLSGHVRDFADSTIAGAAEVWTRRGIGVDIAALVLAKSLLLRLRSHRLPTSQDDEPDRRLSTIPAGPRTDAARGLLQLARFPDHIDGEVVEAIRSFARDDVAWIRYETARDLPNLRLTDPNLMWELLGELAEHEPHDGVLEGVARAAWRLQADLDDAIALLDRVSARVTAVKHRDSALKSCTESAGLLFVLTGHIRAHEILRRLSDVGTYGADGLTATLHEIRGAGAFTTDDDGVRARALEVCNELVDVALEVLGDVEGAGQDVDDERQAQIKAAVEVLDSVASQLYFASGAFEERRNRSGNTPSGAEVRLADEAASLISRLGRVPLPRLVHHLVEFLEHFLDPRPQPALLAVRDIVTGGGQRSGYQLDKMAVDLTVRIVERLLADHRGLLQNPECLTALRQILDVFVDAGWPDAHRLVYGLEHIFR